MKIEDEKLCDELGGNRRQRNTPRPVSRPRPAKVKGDKCRESDPDEFKVDEL